MMNYEMKNEQNHEEFSEDKKGFIAWIKTHKKQLIIAGFTIVSIILIVEVLKNKDDIKGLWTSLKAEIERIDLHSNKWFKAATDSELNIEREKIRMDWINSGKNNLSINESDRLYGLLKRFDNEMSNRAWGGSTDYGYPVHREHGWYLPNDD